MAAHRVENPKHPATRYRIASRNALNHFKKWQPWEDKQLNGGALIRDIARELGRSMDAVFARKARLKQCRS